MKRKALLLLGTALLLTGCGGAQSTVSDSSESIMTIGDTTYTKGDLYDLLKAASGGNMSVELIRQAILDEEIGRGDEIKQAAQDSYAELESNTPDIEDQLISAGYEGKDDYIDKVLIPNAQYEKLTEKYFDDAKSDIRSEYKPSVVKIIQCDDEKTAQKALEAVQDGTELDKVYEEYSSDSASYSNEEVLITTQSTDLPTRLINTMYKQEDAGVADEVFTSKSGSGTTTAYVAILVDNDYENIKDQIIENLSSSSDFSTQCLVYYLNKYNFTVHDQTVFDYLRENNPEYLVEFPELSERDEGQS